MESPLEACYEPCSANMIIPTMTPVAIATMMATITPRIHFRLSSFVSMRTSVGAISLRFTYSSARVSILVSRSFIVASVMVYLVSLVSANYDIVLALCQRFCNLIILGSSERKQMKRAPFADRSDHRRAGADEGGVKVNMEGLSCGIKLVLWPVRIILFTWLYKFLRKDEYGVQD